MSSLKVILATDAIRRPLTGIGRYAYELAKGLQNHPDVEDLKLLHRIRWCSHPDDLMGVLTPPSAATLHRPNHPLIQTLGRTLAPPIKWLRCLPFKDYLYHSPNYALPLVPGRCVSTIHDLSVIRHPEFHPKERVDHMNRLFPSILRRGDLFLTDSDFSRTEIIDYFKIEPDRVVAIPLGVDASFQPQAQAQLEPVLATYGLRPQGYSLSVGTIEPRKNLERLIEAYQSLPKTLRNDIPLVLVGFEGWNSEAIHQKIREGQKEGWLLYLSYVPEEDLPAIYAGAKVFVCASLYEGFGLPVLEAMASGVPVITSKAASLKEVAGDSARFIDPYDLESIRSNIHALLEQGDEQKALRQKGLQRAAQFTWANTVHETISAYQRLV